MAKGQRGVEMENLSGGYRSGKWYFYRENGELIEMVKIKHEIIMSCGYGIREKYEIKEDETVPLFRKTDEIGIGYIRFPQIVALKKNNF